MIAASPMARIVRRGSVATICETCGPFASVRLQMELRAWKVALCCASMAFVAIRPSSADQASVVMIHSGEIQEYSSLSNVAASAECLSAKLPITTRVGCRRLLIMLPVTRKSGLAMRSNDAVVALSSYLSMLECIYNRDQIRTRWRMALVLPRPL